MHGGQQVVEQQAHALARGVEEPHHKRARLPQRVRDLSWVQQLYLWLEEHSLQQIRPRMRLRDKHDVHTTCAKSADADMRCGGMPSQRLKPLPKRLWLTRAPAQDK